MLEPFGWSAFQTSPHAPRYHSAADALEAVRDSIESAREDEAPPHASGRLTETT